MRRRREHVPAVASRRRQRRVGGRRPVQIEREVAREALVYEDIVEQPAVARPQQDFVVSDVVVSAIGAEVEHEVRHRVAQAADAAIAGAVAEARRHQLEIGVCHVRVADDGVGGQRLPARQPHAGCPADLLVHDDLARLTAKRQRPAALHEEPRSARQSRRR
jgi:hypothetical protein